MLVSGALRGSRPGRRPCSGAFRRALQAPRLRVHLSALWQGKRRRGEGRTGQPSQLSLRISEAISAIEARLSGLVHDCAKNDPVERSRHERFIASRMTVGAIALCLLPLYLLVRGVPSGPEYVAMICLVAPVAAAIVLSRSGRLALAHAISSASLAGLVVCIAATSGGVSARGGGVARRGAARSAALRVAPCGARGERHRRAFGAVSRGSRSRRHPARGRAVAGGGRDAGLRHHGDRARRDARGRALPGRDAPADGRAPARCQRALAPAGDRRSRHLARSQRPCRQGERCRDEAPRRPPLRPRRARAPQPRARLRPPGFPQGDQRRGPRGPSRSRSNSGSISKRPRGARTGTPPG